MITKKRIFVLENHQMAEALANRLEIKVDPILAEFKVYTGGKVDETYLSQHIPEGYDVYFIHNSLTKPEAIKDLLDSPKDKVVAIRETVRFDLLGKREVRYYFGHSTKEFDDILREAGVLKKRYLPTSPNTKKPKNLEKQKE